MAHTEPPNVPEPIVSTDYAGLFDCPANRTPTFESAEYLSDWDDFGEDDECAVDSLDTPASNGSFINPNHPVYPTAAMGVSPYDLSNMSGSNIKDLTSQLDPSSFPEWPIARGGFGEVWKGALALNQDKPRPIAVKRLTMYTATGDEGIKKIAKRTKKELSIWSSLSHENILPLLGTCLFRGGVGIVSEWQDNGNAIDWVRANPDVSRLKLCEGICSGLKYLHDSGVVHGDLRGANVLISKSGQPRLIDFGLASVTGSNAFSVSSTLAGTVRWMAPELQVTERQGTTVEGDIFAFGMTALELFTGLPPFANVNNDIAVLLKYQKGERPSRPPQAKRSNRGGDRTRDVCAPMDNETWDLVEKCWSQDPLSRPTADSILEWFMQKKKRRECDLRVSGGVEFVLDTGYQTHAVL
ncbi:Serine/threonine-protein kinase dst1 [Rhizoctonia solani AG-1 IB]|uniref:Serine/threonine-protein kinase dst1 n=2 Tax=Thanatephorus cucumeris (strain AG1-IB / isolate 7/3/14) TaxID=1108050 RepID=M5CC78_THACB|nr:Serine/threonine-protein kinase dst1 [Rhizoctonia solani AG-1 IB]